MTKATRAVQQRRKNQRTSAKKEFDWRAMFSAEYVNVQLLAVAIGLFGFGAMMVASASVPFTDIYDVSPVHFFLRQTAWILIGALIGLVIYIMPLEIFPKFSVAGIVVSILLLIAVLFMGTEINGATRWISLGPFDLQPSEVAKLGFILYLSAWLARPKETYKTFQESLKAHFWEDLVPFNGLLGVIGGLIIMQPDLDTAAIIGATALVVYYVSGKDMIHTIGTAGIVMLAILAVVFAAVMAPYRLERVQTYVNFLVSGEFSLDDRLGSAYQVQNSLISISEGGVLGTGYGQSLGKSYLSEAAFTDSIYSVVAEEFGLVGSISLILTFLYLMNIGINIAQHAPSKFSALLAMGITTWITLQAFLNIGANLAVIPFGGIPLPFISYGGSSTIVVMVGIAVLMNIHRHSQLAISSKSQRLRKF